MQALPEFWTSPASRLSSFSLEQIIFSLLALSWRFDSNYTYMFFIVAIFGSSKVNRIVKVPFLTIASASTTQLEAKNCSEIYCAVVTRVGLRTRPYIFTGPR